MNCPTCNGTGHVAAPVVGCEPIVIGHETIECWASRPHPGQPHMAILCDPCSACGGYDECDRSCATYDAVPAREPGDDWWLWDDGDLTVTRASDGEGSAWSRKYGPNAQRHGAAA